MEVLAGAKTEERHNDLRRLLMSFAGEELSFDAPR
jgi:hypothetical protein